MDILKQTPLATSRSETTQPGSLSVGNHRMGVAINTPTLRSLPDRAVGRSDSRNSVLPSWLQSSEETSEITLSLE